MKIIAVAVAAGAIGCAAGQKPETSKQATRANAPEWVSRGSGAFAGETGKMFCGVGVVSGVADPSRRRAMADAQARGAIAKLLAAKVTVVDSSQTPPAVQQTVRNFSQAEVSRSPIVDHWVDNDGTELALAQLDLETFKSDLEKTTDLTPQVRETLRANAERSFGEGAASAKRQ